jgi:hypothetical protein
VHGDHGRICPKKPFWVQCDQRSELRHPASCDAYRCPVCGPRKAEEAAALLTWGIREAKRRGYRSRFVTGTLAPEDWPARRQKVRNLRRWCVHEQGCDWEFGWACERGAETGMLHVHGIQWGDDWIDQARLQARWGAHVDIREVRTPGVGVYAVKAALRVAGYTVKSATASAEGLDAHLDLNGGRAAHFSRGFLHGKTKREALAAMRSELAGGEELTWHLEPAWTATAAPGASTGR